MLPLLTSSGDVEPVLETVNASSVGGAFPLMWLLIALPLVMAGILLVAGRRSNSWGPVAAVAAVLGSALIGVVLVFQMASQPEDSRAVVLTLYDWTFAGTFSAPMALRLDPLSISFVLLITLVGSLIHIYSLGYMHDDKDRRKFFAFLNLFIAAMLLLVMADNYLLLYVGWEGVGLASYLLIGFWQHKPSAAVAAKKAFVVNRVGDLGLSVAIMLIFATFGTVTFEHVFAVADEASSTTLTVIGLALLLAACGKSAQFPLQSWLLDAMEGPTPVSALIHAATMVTAGVYLIARSNAIFNLSTTALTAVAVVGTITMLMGAAIASAKDPIKKSLAGSTMSQIGYMVLAAGLGPVGYVFALFHLFTHGIFKAGLFLGAGSVMHGMKNEEDMRRYGALRAFMVLTFGAFFVAYLAIIGIPPFAGFFSKDEIIKTALETNWFYGLAALLGAGLTAFYMTRMVIMTFLGEARWDDDQHPHESPPVMTIPMIILGFGSVFGGIILLFVLDIEAWLEPIVGFAEPDRHISSAILLPVTLAIVAVGVFLAWRQYAQQEVPRVAPSAVSPLTVAARRDLYGDAVNEAVFMRPGLYLTRWLVWFDNKGIDGAVRGIGTGFSALSGRLRTLQTGYARQYALTMVGGALLIAGTLVVVRLA